MLFAPQPLGAAVVVGAARIETRGQLLPGGVANRLQRDPDADLPGARNEFGVAVVDRPVAEDLVGVYGGLVGAAAAC